MLAQALNLAESRLGPDRVRISVARGRPAQVLYDYSRTADMVVVGARGDDGLTGLRIGSVPWQLAGHAHCPVIVIRGTWLPVNQSAGPIVVGVDDSGRDLVRVRGGSAAADAAGRGARALRLARQSRRNRRLEEAFHDAVTTLEKEHPDVSVVRQVMPGRPHHALLAATSGAQLIVIGARGRGGVAGQDLGSVAHVMLHHAQCPLAVIRGRAS